MTLDQFRQLQESILHVQRLALWLCEAGEGRASADALKLVVRMQRIRPAKAEAGQGEA